MFQLKNALTTTVNNQQFNSQRTFWGARLVASSSCSYRGCNDSAQLAVFTDNPGNKIRRQELTPVDHLQPNRRFV
jgi:hypothetical protein